MSGLRVISTRIVRDHRFQYRAFVLSRYGDDSDTDLWFLVCTARTRRGARLQLQRFARDKR